MSGSTKGLLTNGGRQYGSWAKFFIDLRKANESDDLGGETVTLQVGLDDQWTDTDSVDFTVVELEFKNEQMSR